MSALQIDQHLADQMIDQAVQACADLRFHGDRAQTLQAMQQGRCDVCHLFSDCLVRQVGDTLGQVDRTVKEIYQVEPEFADRQLKSGPVKENATYGGINLVAWVERKSAALSAFGVTLENALSESRRRIDCKNATPACYTLDIQVVDDRDVSENRGSGLVIKSRYIRSAQIWQRDVGSLEAGDRQAQALLAALDPEFSPESALFEQADAIEKLPASERQAYEHYLREIKVALIRRLISDQLAYITIAKEWFTFKDLAEIFQRKIGLGRIGGKAAGMALAARILRETLDEPLSSAIQTPESFFIGSDVMYIFMAMNGLMHWNTEKYKSEDQIRSENPQIRQEFIQGRFPPEILCELEGLLAQVGSQPVIVRSSSLLEDNFGTSFAGKYESIFLANQGSTAENLEALTGAIARIYSSTLKPDTLLYRRSKGLQDYDERMAVLIQAVQGERYGRYYFPFAAGVAFSRNLYRWSPQIRKQDGFVRLVWGLGTRAVERVGNDYPRMIALSHPNLHPDDDPQAIRYYSQQNVDLIDLQDNCLATLPIHDVIHSDDPTLRYLAQVEEDGYFATPRGRVLAADIPRLAITFDELLRRTPFPSLLTTILHTLEENYRVPVDLEFTIQLTNLGQPRPQVRLSLLQCRPQSILQEGQNRAVPTDLDPEDIFFTSSFMVPQGYLSHIQKVIFVSPEGYFSLPTQAARNEIRRAIAQLNGTLPQKSFLCVGPGRWGTVNPDLGVFVSYTDIDQSAALVELSGKGIGPAPEPSLGTHFFQDLMEAQIYPVAICMDEKGASFNREFFYGAPNHLLEYVDASPSLESCLKVLDVSDYRPGGYMELIMDEEKNQAIAFYVAQG